MTVALFEYESPRLRTFSKVTGAFGLPNTDQIAIAIAFIHHTALAIPSKLNAKRSYDLPPSMVTTDTNMN